MITNGHDLSYAENLSKTVRHISNTDLKTLDFAWDPCHTMFIPNETNQMQRLDVICPPAPWENTTTDEDRAWDLCLSLSEEYGYAQVRHNGIIIGDYTNGR